MISIYQNHKGPNIVTSPTYLFIYIYIHRHGYESTTSTNPNQQPPTGWWLVLNQRSNTLSLHHEHGTIQYTTFRRESTNADEAICFICLRWELQKFLLGIFGSLTFNDVRFNDVSGYATNISSNIYKWITDEGDSSSSSIISGGDVSTSAKRRPVRTSLIFGCSAGTSGRSSWTVTKITIKILWIDQNVQRYWYPLFIFDYVPS